jgi:hypothetical protein
MATSPTYPWDSVNYTGGDEHKRVGAGCRDNSTVPPHSRHRLLGSFFDGFWNAVLSYSPGGLKIAEVVKPTPWNPTIPPMS